jgi:hypothetical protein
MLQFWRMAPATSHVTQGWLARAKSAWPLLIVAIVVALVAASALFAFSPPKNSPQQIPIKDLYDGIATLDKNGEATIELPISVTTDHGSFTYQVRPIGSPMPKLFIKSELNNNRFVVAGGTPGGKISWQLIGTRKTP